MKKYISIRTAGLLAAVVLAGSSCTKNFESYNTNQGSLNNSQTIAILPTAYGPLEQSIYSNYQIAQNLSADAFGGYMMSPTPFKASYDLNYFLVDSWDRTGFVDQYNLVMAPVSKIAATGVRTTKPELWAVALAMQVEAMHRVTDRFGPIPYSKAGTSITSVAYDSQKDVYALFFKQLDTVTANLSAYLSAHPTDTSSLGANDLVYQGHLDKWLKFANSLRLRLAMRIVKADAVTAQVQAEKAMTAPGGLMTTPADDAKFAQSGGRNNDIWLVTASYGDNNLNAALMTYMTGYNDPRLPKYATPATDPAVAGKYTGIRIGINIDSKDTYRGYAAPNTTSTFTQTAPQYFMTAAEIWFLKAEAALRGWNGAGDAKTDYETGITTSFQQWGVSAGGYLADATSKQADYVDPKNPANNDTALSAIKIQWDAGATNEVKLERIITQKWLAIFPDGQEAWAEFRRTGYPKLFPVVNNMSGGTIDTKVQIRRLAYPQSEYTSNGAAVTSAVQGLLGGPDNGGTRLWWDVNKGNF
ncbi:MAG TPA: SusD/RagB family nutrient-binding outer membrane lipoprotein [Puia sp.]